MDDYLFTIRVTRAAQMRQLLEVARRDFDSQYCFLIHSSVPQADYLAIVQVLGQHNLASRRQDFIAYPRNEHGNPRPTIEVRKLRDFRQMVNELGTDFVVSIPVKVDRTERLTIRAAARHWGVEVC